MRKLRADEGERMLATIDLGIFLTLHFQSRNKNIAIYRTVILPGMICGCETWPSYKANRLKLFADGVLGMILGSHGEGTTEGRKKTA